MQTIFKALAICKKCKKWRIENVKKKPGGRGVKNKKMLN